jgi:hypothetical protein
MKYVFWGQGQSQLDRIRYDIYYRLHGDELVMLCLWRSNRGRQPRI